MLFTKYRIPVVAIFATNVVADTATATLCIYKFGLSKLPSYKYFYNIEYDYAHNNKHEYLQFVTEPERFTPNVITKFSKVLVSDTPFIDDPKTGATMAFGLSFPEKKNPGAACKISVQGYIAGKIDTTIKWGGSVGVSSVQFSQDKLSKTCSRGLQYIEYRDDDGTGGERNWDYKNSRMMLAVGGNAKKVSDGNAKKVAFNISDEPSGEEPELDDEEDYEEDYEGESDE